MSRSQQGQVLNQATGQNSTYNANAQTSYNNAQTDEQNFENQLGKYAADNPYGEGGQFQTSENKVLANTADAGAQSAGNAIQSAAVRTGENPAGAIAATEAMQEQNDRNLAGQEGEANAERIGKQADYNAGVLSASEQPASFEAQLAGQQAQAAQGTLSTAEQAAQTPSFMDELGQGAINAGVAFAGGYGKSVCWIAAELYGGWDDPRTLSIRNWINGPFATHWYGRSLRRLYVRYGERTAKSMQTNRWLRSGFQWLFDRALRASRKGGR